MRVHQQNSDGSLSFRDNCLRFLPKKKSDGRCLVIGEVAQSHDGSLGLAHSFIDAIARAGADAVKFQTHIASEESTPDEPWRVKFSRQDSSRYAYWKRMEFTEKQWHGLKDHAEDAGLLFLSTPFSEAAVDLLREIGMKVWKAASGEIANLLLIKHMTADGAPVILSSGMSGWQELDEAVDLVKAAGNPLAVLQCTSAYPCPPEQVGLNLLDEMRGRYATAVGLSDHSGTIYSGLAAAVMGAEVLEVHVTLSHEMFGPDVPASVTTDQLSQLVQGVRYIERMLGSPVSKERVAEEMQPLRQLFTKSVVAGANLTAGTILTREHLKLKKPGTGLHPSSLPKLIGRRLLRNVLADEMLQFADVEAD